MTNKILRASNTRTPARFKPTASSVPITHALKILRKEERKEERKNEREGNTVKKEKYPFSRTNATTTAV